MRYSVDSKNKTIFGWTAKCGSSHVKSLYWFFQNGNINNKIHTKLDHQELPEDIENYTTIIICRNPYKRLVSGFLEKYRENGEFRHLWKDEKITFSKFVDELIKRNWSIIDINHFIPQTERDFSTKILNSKCVKCYDIENIDYQYIERLHNTEIPQKLIEKKYGHERLKYNKAFTDYVYDLDMSEYFTYDVDVKLFYNDEIKNKIFKFFENDFTFFKSLGLNYDI